MAQRLARCCASSRAAQKLRDVINAKSNILGDTPSGIDWCVKALHPSDPLTEVRGIPDKSAVPSLLMNYQSTFTLAPPAGATGTWGFNNTLLPHPINLMYHQINATVGGAPVQSNGNYMNAQIAGATHVDKVASFSALAQRWRLAYMSVTCYQDGPDLSNQGTIVVCQTPIKPRVYGTATPRPWTGFPVGASLECAVPTAVYSEEDYPAFEGSQAMPNAYFNRSREGAYVPLKLTKTCQQWHSTADMFNFTTDALGGLGIGSGTIVLPTTAGDAPFPHVNLARVYADNSNNGITGAATFDLLNDTVAHICARNLSVATSFTFFVRLGLEMQVVPTSTLAPQLKLSPMYDSTALKAYFMIARELKDAYPADHNDLGKIWDVISSVAKTVAPFLSAVPVVGPALSMAVPAVASAGDMIRRAVGANAAKNRKAPTGGRDQANASAADIEKARAIVQPVPKVLFARSNFTRRRSTSRARSRSQRRSRSLSRTR